MCPFVCGKSRHVLGIVFMLFPSWVAAASAGQNQGVAPDKHVIVGTTMSGNYFVASQLKEQYDAVLAQVESLKRDLESERTGAPQATARLVALRQQLAKLRDDIEKSKILVPSAKVYSLKETTTFELGAEQYLLITADQVNLVSSDDSKVHCVLEKICLSVDEKPADEELAAIKLIHQYRTAPEIVGQTRQQSEVDEAEFMRKPTSQTMKPEMLAMRKKFVEDIRKSRAIYESLQGKAIDVLTLEGLTYQEGNRQISLEANSKGGGGSSRSQWRRHAILTIRVPKCKSVTVRGALCGLDVQNLPCSLVVTSDGSQDHDYSAQHRIKGVRGKVTIASFPVNLLEDVDGDVEIETVRDFANSGTLHEAGLRRSYPFRPLECRCANIRGALQARFGRMAIQLEDIQGPMDVLSEFGDVTWTIRKPLGSLSRRLRSTSGHLEVHADKAAVVNAQIVLATQYGTVQTNLLQRQFEDFSVGGGTPDARAWRGFQRGNGEQPIGGGGRLLKLFELLRDSNNQPGLFVSSEGGTVIFQVD